MTTRAQLESEREALIDMRSHFEAPSTWHAALTASIARVEALLSLSDEQCALIEKRARNTEATLFRAECNSLEGCAPTSLRTEAHALRTVADIVRRS